MINVIVRVSLLRDNFLFEIYLKQSGLKCWSFTENKGKREKFKKLVVLETFTKMY